MSHGARIKGRVDMIGRRAFGMGLVAGGSALMAVRPAAAQERPRARNAVLVHGAYADGSCWSDVIAHLQRAGLNVAAVQNPLRSLAEDCDFARRTLALQDGPTVLVAHSYGGEVITEIGVDPKVSALVYCAARAPDANEDYAALARTYPTHPRAPASCAAAASRSSAKKRSCATSPATSSPRAPACCTPCRAASPTRCSTHG
jgi:pimeloyl-ACP methyl ester carboxylesterase